MIQSRHCNGAVCCGTPRCGPVRYEKVRYRCYGMVTVRCVLAIRHDVVWDGITRVRWGMVYTVQFGAVWCEILHGNGAVRCGYGTVAVRYDHGTITVRYYHGTVPSRVQHGTVHTVDTHTVHIPWCDVYACTRAHPSTSPPLPSLLLVPPRRSMRLTCADPLLQPKQIN